MRNAGAGDLNEKVYALSVGLVDRCHAPFADLWKTVSGVFGCCVQNMSLAWHGTPGSCKENNESTALRSHSGSYYSRHASGKEACQRRWRKGEPLHPSWFVMSAATADCIHCLKIPRHFVESPTSRARCTNMVQCATVHSCWVSETTLSAP